MNLGLPVLELKEAGEISEGDRLRIDLRAGMVKNLTRDREYRFEPLPGHLTAMLAAGGLEALLEREMRQEQEINSSGGGAKDAR